MRTHEVLERLSPREMPTLSEFERAKFRSSLARDYVTATRLRVAIRRKKLMEKVYKHAG